ncbi:MAG: DUF655 domain-containing protein [Candidatus Heimdallarchaeum aukensis]|uniref:DUF655 domain-containing protein n=1 Tax=Candidatus Heimdallarchaeum aukensis TaxID=2876573 RepID=A0A9Y1BIW7_9ARCH|nr:MAG: DUF655 domain-containing protein [Candidatus Heimdallarchaeum aukensis]
MQYNPEPNKEKSQNQKDNPLDFEFGKIKHVRPPKKSESKILVLDYLPEGKGFSQAPRKEPIILGIGTKWFSLLEVSLRKRGNYAKFTELKLPRPDEENGDTPIKRILRQISIDELTNTAYEALDEAICLIIGKNEKRFVTFFNKAQPITNKLHALKLIPGIGKQLMWEILEERKKLPFVSFKDIEDRVKVTDISKMIQKRIRQELEGDEKHLLFTAKLELDKKSDYRKRFRGQKY